jgi:lipopolysaccharide transport system ATP-binding protein
MSSDQIVIDVKNLSKRYEIYATPRDRLKQLLIPSLHRIFARTVNLFGGNFNFSPPQYFREFWALHDASFQIKKGETLGIIGRNGSGKSTLLQIICGTLSQTNGDFVAKGRISALLELGSGFNPEYTGRENVFLNGQILGLTKKEIEDRYEAIVGFADIGDFIEQPTKVYSSGMIVRLAFSVAVNVDPEILVVDEALAVGDMPFQIKCFERLRNLRESGVTILFVTHSLETVRSFCDRAIYLDSGLTLLLGPANEVCRQYELDCLSDKLKPVQTQPHNTLATSVTSQVLNEFTSNEILQTLKVQSAAFLSKDREGSNSVTILSFIIVDEDECVVESVKPTQKVNAYFLLQINQELARDFHLSIQLHDRQGFPLMVVRDSTFERVLQGQRGDIFVASMPMRLPFMAGQYYCQVGISLFPIGEKYSGGRFNFQRAEVANIINHAAYLRVLPFTHHPIPVSVLQETKMTFASVNGNL